MSEIQFIHINSKKKVEITAIKNFERKKMILKVEHFLNTFNKDHFKSSGKKETDTQRTTT